VRSLINFNDPLRYSLVPLVYQVLKYLEREGISQKGTIGMILDEEDMPFTEDGVCPDIIINPHAIPSRMTIGQLIECVMGKVGALKGKFYDGTPFQDFNYNKLTEELDGLGFQNSGFETLYNGETGEKIKSQIFIGPTYYQRLKHMVKDKMHARSRGPVQNLTRQPCEGRSRDGGLRMGEMEMDCILSHGMAYFMKEKTFECSDKYQVNLCDKCGNIANVNERQNISFCNFCNNKCNFSKVNMPYSNKLLMNELMGMSLMPKFYTN
jgi:DNA-directed RNA polymerase II subunit RPB2